MRYILAVFLLSISLFLPLIQRQGTNTTMYVKLINGPLENVWFSVTYHLPDGSKKLVEERQTPRAIGGTLDRKERNSWNISQFCMVWENPDKNGVYFHEFRGREMSKLAKEEMETHVSRMALDKEWEVYTDDPHTLRNFNPLALNLWGLGGGEGVSVGRRNVDFAEETQGQDSDGKTEGRTEKG